MLDIHTQLTRTEPHPLLEGSIAMESRKPQEPSKSSRSKGRQSRRSDNEKSMAFKGQTLSQGQLHLLRNLIAENADALEADVRDGEFKLRSTVPNMLEYIHYELEKLREGQDLLLRAWRDQEAR